MTAINKFTGKAGVYSKYRPCYPEDYIDYLITINSLGTGSVVADIGSGTGIFSRQLLDRGLAVFAVEPNADMRHEAGQLLGSYPSFTPVNGKAEDTTLEGGCADLVTAAQAFHWFNHGKFKAECKRILKKGAKVALVWNNRDDACELVRENEEICKEYCPDYIASSGGIFAIQGVFEEFFKGGAYEFKTFRNDEQYDLEGFIGRNLSGSYAPKEGDDKYIPFLEELTALFGKYKNDGRIILQSITRSYLGNV